MKHFDLHPRRTPGLMLILHIVGVAALVVASVAAIADQSARFVSGQEIAGVHEIPAFIAGRVELTPGLTPEGLDAGRRRRPGRSLRHTNARQGRARRERVVSFVRVLPETVPMVVALIGMVALVASVNSWFPPGIAVGIGLILLGLGARAHRPDGVGDAASRRMVTDVISATIADMIEQRRARSLYEDGSK